MLKEILYDGRWGTIGPKSILASKMLKEYTKNKYCILTYSPSAALEALMRSLDIGWGDKVLMGVDTNPINIMVTKAILAEPVFCDLKDLDSSIKAIIVDKMSKELHQKLSEIKIIENSGDCLDKRDYSVFARIVDLGSKRSLNCGLAGAILTDDEDVYIRAYAYHNCGRIVGQADNLKVEDFVGGNMRIPEWQAGKIIEKLEGL